MLLTVCIPGRRYFHKAGILSSWFIARGAILGINECLVTRTSLVTTKQLKFQKGIWTYIYETSRRGNKALVKVIGNKVLCIIPVLWMVLNGPRMHAQTCTCLRDHRECVRPMLTLTLTQTDVTSTGMQKETSETRRTSIDWACLIFLSPVFSILSYLFNEETLRGDPGHWHIFLISYLVLIKPYNHLLFS